MNLPATSAIEFCRRNRIKSRPRYLVAGGWANSAKEAIAAARDHRVDEVLAHTVHEKTWRVLRVAGSRLVDTGKRRRKAGP